MSQSRFDPAGFVDAVKDALTVRRVYGDAYERDGTLVIPVATVLGAQGLGTGGGQGTQGAGGHGGGGSFALRVRPIGVYVVTDDGVRWRPTLDLGRAVLGGQLLVATVAVTALVTRAVRRTIRG